MKRHTTFCPRLEQLDDRAMPSVSLAGGILTVGGTAGSDTIQVARAAGGRIQVTVSSTGEVRRFAESSVNRIDLRGGDGNDLLVIGPFITISSDIRGGRGNDTVLGGGGADDIFGGLGHDVLRGRGGSDDMNGGDGDDDIRGGAGDDHMDGGSGRDNCNGQGGTDDVVNGMDQEIELTTILAPTGVIPAANGSASFGFQLSADETEREFEVEAEDLTPGTTANVVVDGVSVGTMTMNAQGKWRLKLKLEFDSDHNGIMSFPSNFPEIHVGSTIDIRVNGAVVLSGTFA